jgi:hypothetical protein
VTRGEAGFSLRFLVISFLVIWGGGGGGVVTCRHVIANSKSGIAHQDESQAVKQGCSGRAESTCGREQLHGVACYAQAWNKDRRVYYE